MRLAKRCAITAGLVIVIDAAVIAGAMFKDWRAGRAYETRRLDAGRQMWLETP